MEGSPERSPEGTEREREIPPPPDPLLPVVVEFSIMGFLELGFLVGEFLLLGIWVVQNLDGGFLVGEFYC